MIKRILFFSTMLWLIGWSAQGATLSVSPSSATVNVGDNITVQIMLDTQGQSVEGVDLNTFNYNPSMLSAQDSDTAVSGVQISSGTLMPNTVFNSVDSAVGKIQFSQVTAGGQSYTGQGVLAAITFQALQSGTVSLSFDFLSGSTVDTNVAHNGSDVLTSVSGGVLTLSGSSILTPTPPPPSAPTPTPMPISSGGGGGGYSFPAPSASPTVSPTPLPSGSVRPKPSAFNLQEGEVVAAYGSDDPDVYIVNEHGFKRLFLNPAIFNFYGHLGGFVKVKTIPFSTRDALETSGLFRNCEANDPQVYVVEVTGEDGGIFHHINLSGEQAVAQDAEFFKKIFCINTREFNWYAKGVAYTFLSQIPKYNRPALVVGTRLKQALAKTSDSATTYYINANGIKKPVPSGLVFSSYGNRPEDIKVLSLQELATYPDYQGIIYNSQVFIIENNLKRHIKDLVVFQRLKLDWNRIVSVNRTEFDYYQTGMEVE